MKRLLISTAAMATGLVLAACGSGYGSTASNASPPGTPPAGRAMTVSATQVNGLGSVLVDPSGKVLYTPDQEADGKVRCEGVCNSFWMPLAPGAGFISATSAVTGLGVIHRPDGAKQVTDNGKPLYTFVEDSPGTTRGEGFSDAFGSQHFTWHAVLASGTIAAPPTTTANGSSTGSNNPSGGGGGYSY
jgi:predicted lipoprotein with Yx(FWY)xxD motif